MNALADIEKLMSVEVAQFRQAYEKSLASDNPLLQQVAEHLLARRGKQLRPMLVLLSAKMCRGVNEKTIDAAVAFELLHTASLVHDDVVDDSPMRRGVATVQKRWTNKVAVLTGDYLLAKVIELTAGLRNLKLFNIVAEIGQTLAKGEVLQLHANGSMWISESDYFKIIEQKTAALFAACTQAGAVSTGASMRAETALRTYGLELGLMFQMKDDLLDYSDSEDTGKPTMSDIRDGKATLPLLISLQRAPQTEADEIRRLAEDLSAGTLALEGRTPEEAATRAEQTILSFVLRYDGIRYVQQQMEAHKRRAIEALSVFHDSSLKAALIQLLEYTVTRVY
ncbi:MAG: polyprenyl synthetase family protein [Paludibacteraceae bacterium]|nr:polyprenyl synthetase family protein [Paludibacteraceae bacterium]